MRIEAVKERVLTSLGKAGEKVREKFDYHFRGIVYIDVHIDPRDV